MHIRCPKRGVDARVPHVAFARVVGGNRGASARQRLIGSRVADVALLIVELFAVCCCI